MPLAPSDVLLLVGLGTLAGAASSVPPGPTKFWLTLAVTPGATPYRNARTGGRPIGDLVAFVVGVILCDLVYAGLSFWGYAAWLVDAPASRWIGLAASLIVAALGTYDLFTALRDRRARQRSEQLQAGRSDHLVRHPSLRANEPGFSRAFTVGLTLGLANPAFVAFWLWFAAEAQNFGADLTDSATRLLLLWGIVLGNVIWYGLYTWLSILGMRRLGRALQGAVWIDRVRILIASLMIGAGLYAALRFLLQML